MPDLVPIELEASTVELVAQTNVTVGYVYADDFVGGKAAANPAEAVQLMKERVDEHGDIWIPVYDRDGKTGLGRLKLGHVTESR